MVGKGEGAGQRVDIALAGHPAYDQTLHLGADLLLRRYDQPCSLDEHGTCTKASYDSRLAGHPAAFGLFLPEQKHLPAGYDVSRVDDSFLVRSGIANHHGGALSSGSYQFSGSSIPHEFSLRLGEEWFNGTLVQFDGVLPNVGHETAAPVVLTSLTPLAFPGGDSDFLGVGASPQQIFQALLDQDMRASQQWASGGCLRRLVVFVQPSFEVTLPAPSQPAIYKIESEIEWDGGTTSWSYDAVPLGGFVLVSSVLEASKEKTSDCHLARTLQMQLSAGDFWLDEAYQSIRGEPTRFEVAAGAFSPGEAAVVSYGIEYQPPGGGGFYFPNLVKRSAQNGELLFLETSPREQPPALA